MKTARTLGAFAAIGLFSLIFTNNVSAQTSAFSRDLTIGSTGTDVSALQQVLATAGTFNMPPTGFFGAITKAALASWQASKGLPATGFFGPMSRAALSIGDTLPTFPSGPAPHITNILPMATSTGATVTLTGTGFTAHGNNVNFGVFRAVSNVSSVDGKTLVFKIPNTLSADCAANVACPLWARVLGSGAELVSVKNTNGTSNTLTLNIK
jgi:peptidoglycan hydrolase-like protein with peptidoglycan-binding domain